MLLKLLIAALLIYAAILATFFFAQTALIFPARMVQGAGPLPPGAGRLTLETPDGNRLHGVHIPASLRRGEGRPVILGFPGNAWNAEDNALFLHSLFPDEDVVVFHYRGYQPSTGKPGAAALLADAPLVHDLVSKRFGGRPVVAAGFSIGAGVAGHLASVRQIGGAILVTPFDSLDAVGRGHYPWLPVSLFLRHRMNPAKDLGGSRVPIAILVAGRDTLIPPQRAEALARAVANLVFERTLGRAGHNDIYQDPAFQPAMYEALAALLKAGAPAPQK
ncbi:MAG TPA: hypothetical protein VK391_09065 [Allosphingosinicella sp.]|nr:hypothetical protein [Allosphingosinicella sp.]